MSAEDSKPKDRAPEPVLPKIAAGEAGAAQECIDRYKGLLWWLARNKVADPEDAVQEIFIALWENAARYDPSRSSEPAFVSLIARRRLIDRQRKRGRRPQTDSLDTSDREGLERADWLPAVSGESIEVGAEAALAARAVRDLATQEVRVIKLSVVSGMSHSEIADVTSIPLGTVKTYIRRGLARVRDALEVRSQVRPGGAG